MATPAKRQHPPTHPTVWIGLGLAAIGLLVAAYAYTGSRVYDITFAFVALAGGLLALAGILVAAWGRAVMAARAQRARRATSVPVKDEPKAPSPPEEQPPTVAEPRSKKSFDFAAAARRVLPRRTPRARNGASAAAVAAVEAPLERVTLKCPECAHQFSAEGRRPFRAACPTCAFAAEVA